MPELQRSRFSGFLSRSLLTAGTRFLDLPSRYGFHLLVVARLSIANVGGFYIVFSVMTLAAGFGRLGIDRALTREVAAALGREQVEVVRPAVWRAFLVTMIQTGIVAALFAVSATPIATYLLHKPALALPLMLGALTIVPQNLSTTAAGALAGMGHVATSQMIYSWLWPGLFCLAALTMPLQVNSTLLLIGASLLINAVVGILLMMRTLPPKSSARNGSVAGIAQRALFTIGLSFFSLEVVQLAIASAPSFILGMVASTADVGRYALAWRIVLVLNLLVSAMAAIASPQFARAHAQGDDEALVRISAQIVGLTTALSIMPFVVLAAYPMFFLTRFGAGYAAAAPILRILLAGQGVLVLCTAMPELLGMAGFARLLMKINLVSLTVLLLALTWLSRSYGSEGAAIATALTMAVNGIAVSIAVKRRFGFIPILSFGRIFQRND